MSVVVCVARAGPAPARVETLSIERLPITARERIVGFDFHIHSPRVVSMRDIPSGWDVRVQNSPSWRAEVKGSALVGAAAVGPQFLTNFLRVEKNESLGLAFELKGTVVVTQDFVQERHIAVSTRDVSMTAPRGAASPAQPVNPDQISDFQRSSSGSANSFLGKSFGRLCAFDPVHHRYRREP